MTEPTIVELPARPYVGIAGTVTMTTIGQIADRIPEVFGWLGAKGIEPADGPFFRYYVIDMDGELRLEVGVPLAAAVEGEGEITPGVLPAGRYVTATRVGHPDGLVKTTDEVLEWAAAQGLTWDVSDTDDGKMWGCRLELYRTDPAVQPDMNKWETELRLRLAD